MMKWKAELQQIFGEGKITDQFRIHYCFCVLCTMKEEGYLTPSQFRWGMELLSKWS